jgi:hypothetical protein
MGLVVTNPGGAGGSPGGSNTQVQYNSSGSFAGASFVTTDGATYLGIGSANLATTGGLRLANNVGIYARNAANNANFNIATLTAANLLRLGDGVAGFSYIDLNQAASGITGYVWNGAAFETVLNLTKSSADYVVFGANTVATSGHVRTYWNSSAIPLWYAYVNTLTATKPVIEVSTAGAIIIGESGATVWDGQFYVATLSLWGKTAFNLYGTGAGNLVAQTTADAFKQPRGQVVNVVQKTTGYTLTTADFHISITTNSTINLPASPANGETYKVTALNASGCTVSGNGKNIGGSASTTLTQYQTGTFVFSSTDNIWLPQKG